jgi:putative transposase
MSQDHNHLNHATWECDYYVSSRRSAARRGYWGKTGGTWTLNSPAQESQIEEGHLMPDHVHQEMANKQVDQMQPKLASS